MKDKGLNPAAVAAALRSDMKNFLVGATPGGIAAQEARGQRDMIAACHLPMDMRGISRAQLEPLGFQFGKQVDDLFIEVKLPPGWRMQATEHSIHSDLLDADGCVRAGIFYKAAFYDRHADITFRCRYFTQYEYEDERLVRSKRRIVAKDSKTGAVLYVSAFMPAFSTEANEEEKLCGAYLDERFPLRHDPLAYWEEA